MRRQPSTSYRSAPTSAAPGDPKDHASNHHPPLPEPPIPAVVSPKSFVTSATSAGGHSTTRVLLVTLPATPPSRASLVVFRLRCLNPHLTLATVLGRLQWQTRQVSRLGLVVMKALGWQAEGRTQVRLPPLRLTNLLKVCDLWKLCPAQLVKQCSKLQSLQPYLAHRACYNSMERHTSVHPDHQRLCVHGQSTEGAAWPVRASRGARDGGPVT